MASKKTGRLAGLAALAGAAYLASKGKEGAGVKADRDDADRYTGSRTPAAEAAMSDMGEDERPAPTGMGAATKLLAPSKTARPSAPAETQRFAPAGSPVLSSGAGSGGPRTIGLGRSSGRGGAEAGEEAAYKSAKEAQALKDFSAKRPGIMARMREKDKAMMEDGGKSTVDRQDAAAARASRSQVPAGGKDVSVEDYYTSGKAKLDAGLKRGGAVKKMASGGMTSSASKRGDGIASKGKTRCKMY